MKRFLVLTLAALSLYAAGPRKQPKLVLMIVVDQFRYDYLTRFRADYNSGLARLLDHGAVFTDARYDHYPTVTAVGHSTVMSGATPAISGIIANDWYDRGTKKSVSSVSDDNTEIVGTTGKKASSPHRMLVSTISDELKMSGKGSPKVIGISIKDRSAILPVGRMADAAYWFDNASGRFVSSTWYFKEIPDWVKTFNDAHPGDQYAAKEWRPLAGGDVFVKMAAKGDKKLYNNLEKSPYGNEMIEAFTERAIAEEKLGQRGSTDVLAVSFSANDYVGHAVGPDDPQVKDMAIRTDRLFGKLFQYLESKVGMANVTVVLTADHGVAPVPEVSEKRKMPGGRFKVESMEEAINKHLSKLYGDAKWVEGKTLVGPYLNWAVIAEKKLNAAAVRIAAAEAVGNLPHVVRVYTREQLMRNEVPRDAVGRRVANGFYAPRAADLCVVLEPYWFFGESATGTSHMSTYSYDNHVPMIFMGPGIRAGRYYKPVIVNDIAPTLAVLLDIETPSGSVGRVLDEILAVLP